MVPAVAAFTDSYLPTVNGVTYTVSAWRDCWRERDGRMDVVYPEAPGYDPGAGEYPVRSVSFPFYDGFRVGVPRIPAPVRDAAVVHCHTPFGLGLAGRRLARRRDRPLVASYHTPIGEYAGYLAVRGTGEEAIRSACRRYERWFYGSADVVVAPSESTATHLRETVRVDARVAPVPNGVDTERFRPVADQVAAFRDRHDLPDGPLVGYTGRHGFEKRLDLLVDAAEGLDATLVFGGDGPARKTLTERAERRGVDARFLGFLDREELPALYAALDVFAFPSPVETQGLVALEANACGTPVVGANSAALAETVDDGETGYTFEPGDAADFRARIERALDERERLRENCLARRDEYSLDHAVDRLESVYAELVD